MSDEPIRTLAGVGTETTPIAFRPAQNAALAATIAALASLILFVRRPRRGGRRRASLSRATVKPAPPGVGILVSFPRGRSEHDPALRAAADPLRRAALGRIDQAHRRVILLAGVEERSGVTVVARRCC